MHLLSPLMQVRSVYSSFIGAIHIVRSSLVTYFVSDDSQIVAVESEPQIIMEVMPEAEKAPNMEKAPSMDEAQQKSRQRKTMLILDGLIFFTLKEYYRKF